MKFPENVCKISKYILHFVNIIVKQTICPQNQCPKGMKTLEKPCKFKIEMVLRAWNYRGGFPPPMLSVECDDIDIRLIAQLNKHCIVRTYIKIKQKS